jgi:hypothetical protein
MFVSHHQIAGKNHERYLIKHLKIAKFKYIGMTTTNQNWIHEEINSRLNLGNAGYHAADTLLYSQTLSKNIHFKIYKTIILPFVLYGCETWFLTLREEYIWGYLRTGCWGEYLDIRGKWQEAGENCIMRSSVICTLQRLLLRWSNQGKWYVWEM